VLLRTRVLALIVGQQAVEVEGTQARLQIQLDISGGDRGHERGLMCRKPHQPEPEDTPPLDGIVSLDVVTQWCPLVAPVLGLRFSFGFSLGLISVLRA